jgi:hypothetical protein
LPDALSGGRAGPGPWRVERFDAFVVRLRAAAGTPVGRPPVVAVDGRGFSGKTSRSGRIADAVAGAAVVHTDDIAWRHAAFDWADLLAEGCWLRCAPHARSRTGRRSGTSTTVPARSRRGTRCGTPELPHDRATDVVVAPPP